MKFGVFDHMDRAGPALATQYEDRLRLAALYDELGFHMYHVAEHHSTPLGMAPSPGIFLSAVAQRTKRLRFGPLVYPIKLYHPLRLAEEICMLDHLSGGRFEFGVGKGASPIELSLFGVDPADTEPQFAEALTVLQQALTLEVVNFQGRFYAFKDVPVEMKPFQRPSPAIWYGIPKPDSAVRAARNRYNIVCNLPAAGARAVTDAYRAEWAASGGEGPLPLMGVGRFVVIADSDAEAKAAAERAFPRWYDSFWKLWDEKGERPPVPLPDSFEGIEQAGIGVAGAPRTVLAALRPQLQQSGANYLLCRFAFGDLSFEESARSARLFARQVAPALTAAAEGAA